MSNSLDPDQARGLSGLIWVQNVCKGYRQTTLGDKEVNMHVQQWGGGLNFDLSLSPCFVCASNKGSGKTVSETLLLAHVLSIKIS